MSEQDEVYSSKISYKGFFRFKDLYSFCYNWLSEEAGLSVDEGEYSEKISGPIKNISFKWTASKEVTDYFQFEVKLDFKVDELSEVEANIGGAKVKTNSGGVTIKVKASLVRDYEGKFETSGKMKLWRGIYEKWIISQRVSEFEDKLAGLADEFLSQAKAFLDLESANK
ncbi:MAG: hypothetical protein NUV46_03620 [Nanoarchaeota archaeon]|nr:hypothetical protein [Nanoarchaeota archaeon]